MDNTADERPPIFAFKWDDWNHPLRAIAAIGVSIGLLCAGFVELLPELSELAIQVEITVAIALVVFIPLGFTVPFLAVTLAARFD